MTPEALEIFNTLMNAGQLLALVAVVFKAGRWIGDFERWQQSQDVRIARLEKVGR